MKISSVSLILVLFIFSPEQTIILIELLIFRAPTANPIQCSVAVVILPWSKNAAFS